MKLSIQSILPIGLLVFAAGYIAFVYSQPNQRMAGDSFGYDPGGQLMPLAAAAVLVATALWELMRNWSHREDRSGQETAPLWLLFTNLALIVAFIALFRPLGFILTTSLMLYVMIALNLRSAGQQLDVRQLVAGFAGCAAYAVALYSLIRGVVRLCFIGAREYGLVFLREPTVQAILIMAVLSLALLAAGVILPRLTRHKVLTAILQSTVGITLAVYVIFRLLFLVQLPAGLLTW